ncbi:alpha/beta fold hydrolase [Streptomyces liangshanensis]|uniref:Alpha/beta hydrolase n=1 Tax=Streptomyces liangshanensis TaxID=2717324 RepID=A0A6G9GWC1_9ACTN|nr:alpha/beta hydrolase [Streptomyces liangshanensis]QIQ02515.1 alpha/beta hydrolase [Streptomyces liangshanensis]
MIDRRTFSAAAVAAPAAGLLAATPASAAPHTPAAHAPAPSATPPATPAPRARNVVLVHGAYTDGSSWTEVIKRLQAKGFTVTSVQNPLSSVAADVDATRRVLDLQDGPTVLAAHSYGGVVISQAGDHPAVTSLVYVAARAPEAGEDYGALAARFPTPPASAGLVFRDGFGQLTEEAFLDDFANGVDQDTARALYVVQGRIAQDLFATRTTAAAWRDKPSWYAVSKRDRTASPDLQRFVAQRMGARTVELDSGHLSLVTHPREITDLIVSAAGH